MITGELKNKIDELWKTFWENGLTQSYKIIEQMTYLMFIRDLDDADLKHQKEAQMLGLGEYKSIFNEKVKVVYSPEDIQEIDANKFRWSQFKDLEATQMYALVQNGVFPFIKNLHDDKNSAYSKYMSDAIFEIPDPSTLSEIIEKLESIYANINSMKNADVRGDVYEYLLSKVSTQGINGQFRTPRHIIKMMVELMEPTEKDIVCDPACGTSGFLVGVSEYLAANKKSEVFFNKENKKHYMNEMFHGYDTDRSMLRIGAMNMMVHGVEKPHLEYRNSLSDANPDKDRYSLILANPPFTGELKPDKISSSLEKICKAKKTELLFLALFLRTLKMGGRCACIVPDGVLFGSSKAHKQIRKEIIEENQLLAVISMPSGVFKPYAGVSTAILIFNRTGSGATDKVWFYDMKADGFSLDDKRQPIEANDIPDIIKRYHNLKDEADRARTEQSFLVDKDEIVKNGYDLSINKYKEIEYVPVEYAPTSQLLAELKELEAEIAQGLTELEAML